STWPTRSARSRPSAWSRSGSTTTCSSSASRPPEALEFRRPSCLSGRAGVRCRRPGGDAIAPILVRLFEHHRWANQRAIEACAGLSEARPAAPVAGTAGSIRETITHLVGAEQRYVSRLTGRPPGYHEREGWPGAAALAATLDQSGQALVELAGRADPDEMLEG